METAVWIAVLFASVITHEVAHGWVAERFGDPTARLMGRITLNPLVHIDPIGTVLLPAALLLLGAPFLFGYAKPVPVDFARLSPMRLGTALVAAAGPLVNLVWALAGAWPVAHGHMLWGEPMLTLNALLFVFNMLPIPPLDGSKLVAAMLPERWMWRWWAWERYGLVVVFALLLLGGFAWVMRALVRPLAEALLALAGG
ncbi:MAG: site-2 protease family protein [Zetaproteobacteria bacterium]|nr:MAG: site-2 protease family protein [Zetaproteobacteria bacterium]